MIDNTVLEDQATEAEPDPAFEGDTSKKPRDARKLAVRLMRGDLITDGKGNGDWDTLLRLEKDVEEILNDSFQTLYKNTHYRVAWAQKPQRDMEDMPILTRDALPLKDEEVALFMCIVGEMRAKKSLNDDNPSSWLVSEAALRDAFSDMSPKFMDEKETRLDKRESSFNSAIKTAKKYQWIVEKEMDDAEWIYQITAVTAALVDSGFIAQIEDTVTKDNKKEE